MFTQVEVENFRAIRFLQMQGLGRLNLLVGKNGCGKTSFLEALYLNARSCSLPALLQILAIHDLGEALPRSREILYHPQALLDRSGKHSPMLRIQLGQREFRGEVQSSTDPVIRDLIAQRMEKLQPEVFRRLHSSAVHFYSGQKPKFSASRDVSLDWLALGDLVAAPYTYFAKGMPEPIPCCLLPAFEPMGAATVERWERVILEGRQKFVESALRCVIPDIDRLDFVVGPSGLASSPTITFKAGNSRPIPLRAVGDGVFRALQLALAMVEAQNGIFLVDEIESGLHHSVQVDLLRHLLSFSAEFNVQVFATTHSWDTVRALATAAPGEDVRLFRLDLRSTGRHEATPFSPSELAYSTEEGIEVR